MSPKGFEPLLLILEITVLTVELRRRTYQMIAKKTTRSINNHMKTFKQWCEAIMPDSMRLSTDHEKELEFIRKAARTRHEKARKAAKKRGRHDFPDFPYEDSWAYENEFRRKKGYQSK